MRRRTRGGRYIDAVVVIFMIAAVIFLSPFVLLWTAPGSPWYLPYLLWAGVIVMTALAGRLRDRDEL
jgi:hypothetical protein